MSGFIINPFAFGATPPTILAKDTFTDTDGTHLNVHAMDVGGGWTVNAGTLAIQSNQLESGSAGGNQAITNVGASEFVISARLVPGSALIVRWASANSFLFANLNLAEQKIELTEWASGIVTVRASQAVSLTAGVLYLMEVTVTAGDVSVVVEGGSPTAYATTLNNGSEIVGVRIFNASRQVDDLLVTT